MVCIHRGCHLRPFQSLSSPTSGRALGPPGALRGSTRMKETVPLRTRVKIAKRLLKFGASLPSGNSAYTTLKRANRLVETNANAWLLAVVFDQLIPAERAWEAPY